MATALRHTALTRTGLPGGRMLEWCILATVALLIAGGLGYYGRQVQAYGERAAVLTTLGALRTALVMDHLQRVAANGGMPVPDPTPNPFLLLKTPPPNYRGVLTAAESFTVARGGWFFDPRCPCVGYLPMDTGRGRATENADWLWFTLSPGPAPHQLLAREAYVWRGLDIR